jgi:glycosyltransferase involved in cell wall biosynthesis
MQWSVIAAVNDERILNSCLLSSPGIQSASEVILQRNYVSAASAYNAAIQKASTDFLVFVHQDVYLPEGWVDQVQNAIESLSQKDPHWGVLGIWGTVDYSDQPVGYLYWTGDLGWEDPFEGAREVIALDEALLIFRKSSGLTFDPQLPSYHLYATDICMEARSRGMKCYAISAFCIHNTRTNSGKLLPRDFWKCYLFMRHKWRSKLPIVTPCTKISFWCWPILHWHFVFLRDWILGRHTKRNPAEDPGKLYGELLARGIVKMPKGTSGAHTGC